jgi:hypothetical protein
MTPQKHPGRLDPAQRRRREPIPLRGLRAERAVDPEPRVAQVLVAGDVVDDHGDKDG